MSSSICLSSLDNILYLFDHFALWAYYVSCQNNAFKSRNIGIANSKEKIITKTKYDFCIYFNCLN